MSKEEYAVEVENISKIYTLRNKNNQYKTDKNIRAKIHKNSRKEISQAKIGSSIPER